MSSADSDDSSSLSSPSPTSAPSAERSTAELASTELAPSSTATPPRVVVPAAPIDVEDPDGNGPLSTYYPPTQARRPRRPGAAPPVERAPYRSRFAPAPPPPPPAPEEQGVRELLDAPLSTDRAPISTWRPKQSYPSYAGPVSTNAPTSTAGRAFAVKVLDHPEELTSAYRLRYQVYETLEYLQHRNDAKIEIDHYDRYAIPVGAISVDTGELVGTVRLITNRVQEPFAALIQRLLDIVKEPSIEASAMAPRQRMLPSIISDEVERLLARYNRQQREVVELSRGIVHPKYRGSGVSRGLMEFAIAYAMGSGRPLLLGGCIPDHLPMYARYGFVKLPGMAIDSFSHVGQAAYTIVSDTRDLPEPTSSRAAMLHQAMRTGEPECLLEEKPPAEVDPKSKSIWHFPKGYAAGEVNAKNPFNPGGARYAVR